MGDRARATVKVKVEILDADSRLFPDMGSTVFFLSTAVASETESNQSRVFCPALALISEGDATFVLMVGPENRIQKLAVEVAETRDDRAVIASGLTGGEKVVISPPEGLQEGTLVRIAQ
jgi:hypothetical protein